MKFPLLVAALLLSFNVPPARHRRGAPPAAAEVRLLEGLGEFHLPVTTSVPEAQKYFDQGMILVYGFNHRSEEHTSELQSRQYLVCRLLLEKKTNRTSLVYACHFTT